MRNPTPDIDEPLSHILSGISLPNGKVPVFEVSEASSGYMYGLYVSAYSFDEHDGEVISEMGYKELVLRKNNGTERVLPEVSLSPLTKVDARLREDVGALNEPTPALLWLKEPLAPMIFLEVQKRVLRGDVYTKREREELRQYLIAQRESAIEDRQSQLMADVASLDVTYRCVNNPCVMGMVDNDTLSLLEADENVQLIESVGDVNEADAQPIGSEIIIANQLEPWWDVGFAGHGINGDEMIVAHLDPGFANEEHEAFRDGGPGSAVRIRSRTGCVSNGGNATCVFPATIPEADETAHATGGLGIILGDGDGSAPGTWLERRGVATEAEAHLFAAIPVNAAIAALGHIQSANPTPHVMNMSMGSDTNDTACSGTNGYAFALNNLYEVGILPVKSAGNGYHSSTTDCNLSAPAAAASALVVGSVGDNDDDDTTAELRNANISDFSARGGTSSQGGGRPIVDLVAVGVRQNMVGISSNTSYSHSDAGTSISTPYVTGAALNLVDWSVHNEAGFLEYNPGLLQAMLVLMTDRWNGSTYRLQGTKDNLYGAGRLRMRLFTEEGLDNPWAWEAGPTCVRDGHETEIPIIGTPIGDIDVLKAAIYFYDPQHEAGGGVDSIDMYIERSDTGATLRTANMVGSDSQFLMLRQNHGGTDVIQNIPLRLVLNGVGISADNVSSSGASCGTNEMLVWYAYYYEDSDRESAENLGDGVCDNEMDCVARE